MKNAMEHVMMVLNRVETNVFPKVNLLITTKIAMDTAFPSPETALVIFLRGFIN